MPLSKKHAEDICLWNEQNYRTCRYCAQDELDPNKLYCLKKSTEKAVADAEVADYLKRLKANNQDPQKQGHPIGDNCQGYPVMHYIMQGYDQKD